MKSNVKARSAIKASVNSAIIGSYTGEVLDSEITNKNGLDITRDVMEIVFASDDYKEGIENGWFIGFLGHPEDPDCQDFKNGCIVMIEGHIDDDGKCYGTFNLIDTPVGQVVKKFIDAGVKFGISIRGAGDIIGNSVDPETFVFRGFDLVAFPAYPNSIPEFKEIAASSNAADRKKYQSVCSAVMKNLDSITSSSSIEVLKTQFAPQSDVYKALSDRSEQLTASDTISIDAERIMAMTDMYIESEHRNSVLASENEKLKIKMARMESAQRRKIEAMHRISGGQLEEMQSELDAVQAKCDALERTKTRITASNDALKKELEAVKSNNLIYKRKAQSAHADSSDKDETIASLQKQLRETVTASRKMQSDASNRDDEIESLRNELIVCQRQLRSYQDAYVQIYASALGANPQSLTVSDATTVAEIEKQVECATNTVNIGVQPAVDMIDDYEETSDDLITI